MKRVLTAAAVLAGGSLYAVQGGAQDDAAMIKSAEAAAPAAVSGGATIYAMDDTGVMRTLREGDNGWWCMPDGTLSPGLDPMCGDAASMDWLMALVGKADPPAGKVGFIYMLAGGSDGSNVDPFAGEPAAGDDWISTPSHVMVVNAPEMMQGYPGGAKPDTSRPYVMYADTPYAHLMIPVQ